MKNLMEAANQVMTGKAEQELNEAQPTHDDVVSATAKHVENVNENENAPDQKEMEKIKQSIIEEVDIYDLIDGDRILEEIGDELDDIAKRMGLDVELFVDDFAVKLTDIKIGYED